MCKIRKCCITVILISALLLSISITALCEDSAGGTTTASKSLSLNQALALGVENNASISLAKLAVEANRINVEQTQFKAKELKKTINHSDTHIAIDQNVYLVLYVNPAQAELDYELAQATLSYTENSVRYGVETAYDSLQVANKALAAAQLSVQRNETQLKNVKAKVNQGLASKLDLYSVESSLLASQADYRAKNDAANYATMLLNQLLGLSVTTDLKLTDELAMTEAGEIKVEEAVNGALATDLTYLTAKNSYDSVVLLSDYTQKFTSSNTYSYQKAEVNRQQAKVSCDNAKTDLEIRVRYAYNKWNTAFTNYQSFTKSRDMAAEAYRLAILRYESGLSTVYDVQNAETVLEQSEAGLLNAEKDYNLAAAAFGYGIYFDPVEETNE